MPAENGHYIVFEGGEAVGKSTQMHNLKGKLDDIGVDSIFTLEPGGTPLGQEIRRMILSPDIPINSDVTELALFMADKTEHWHDVIEPALRAGKVVASDRNWYSTMAYQAAGDPEKENRVEAAVRLFLPPRYIKPDLAFILSLNSPEENVERLSTRYGQPLDAMEQRSREFHEAVFRTYETLPRRFGAIAISASQSRDEVFNDIWSYVSKTIKLPVH